MADASTAADRRVASTHHAVFIDTSLDTHLAMVISDTDTVSDLKKKITHEHPLSFPEFGKIKVDAVKVKRRGHNYHLSDSMLITSALIGVKKNWFLSVDTSSQVEHCGKIQTLNPDLRSIVPHLSTTTETSTDRVNIAVGNQHAQLSNLLVSPTTNVANIVSQGLESVVEQDHRISSRGEYQNGTKANSSMLPDEPLDDVYPLSSSLNTKKRKKKTQASSSCNTADGTHTSLKKQLLEQIHVDDEGTLQKPEQVETGFSSEAHEISKGVKPDNPVEPRDIEMNDVDVDSIEKCRIAAEFVDDGYVLYTSVMRPNNQGMVNSLSAIDISAHVHCPVSGIDGSDKKEVLKDNGPNPSVKEQYSHSREKMDGGIDEVTLACRTLDSENVVKEKFSPKKRKKSSKLKSATEERSVVSNAEHQEGSPSGPSLIEPQEEPNDDHYIDEPENIEINLSQFVGKGATVEDNKESYKEQANEWESVQQIMGKTATENKNEEEKRSKTKKKASTDEKSGHGSRHRIDEGESNVSKEDGEETKVASVDKKSDEDENTIKSSLQMEEGEFNADNSGEKPKKRRKKRSSKEKHVDQFNDRLEEEKSNSAQLLGKETIVTAADEKTDEQHGDEVEKQRTDKAATSYNMEEQTDKKARRRKSKGKNASQLSEGPDKEEITCVLTEGKETLGMADTKLHQEQGNQIESLREVAESEIGADNIEKMEKKTNKKQSRKGKDTDQFSHMSEKEGADEKPDEQHGAEVEKQCTDNAATSYNMEEKTDKKARRRSSKGKNASQLSEGPNKEEIICALTDGKETLVMADSKFHQEQGIQIESLHEAAELEIDADVVEKMEKKTKKKRNTKGKDTDRSIHTSEKEGADTSLAEGRKILEKPAHENFSEEHGHQMNSLQEVTEKQAGEDIIDGKMEKKTKSRRSSKEENVLSTEMRGRDSSNTENLPVEKEHGDGLEEKMEKKTRKRKSSKEKIVSSQEIRGLGSGHNEDVPTENGARSLSDELMMAKGSMSKKGNCTTPTNDSELKCTRGNTFKGNNECNPSKEVAASPPNGNHTDGVNDHMDEVQGSQNINFSDYFAPKESQQEVAASGNDTSKKGRKKTREGNEQKVKGRKIKGVMTTAKASPAWPGLLNLDEPENEEKSQAGKSSSIQIHGSHSGGEPDKLTASPAKESFKVTENGSEVPPLPNSDNNVSVDVGRPKPVQKSAHWEKNGEVSASSTSSLNRVRSTRKAAKSRSSKDNFHVAFRKPSKNDTTEVVDTSEHKRSLLAATGAIFKDESSGSSEHAGGTENSDASTRTPSDKLSDYSDSETDANQKTPNDGNISRSVGGGNGTDKSGLSSAKNLTLDKILRSSSRYKKAKLAAVQSELNDSESQPVDFVPDSQADL